ncbi:hypothetical protein [Ruminococcus sp.]|uniref:hypothetical protein n=1 Tax=Ruminococcus sp. TaxID=41978 RepID=UPI0025D8409A|nr:hypothetical protein [Ruminococcus sp.]MBQ8965764.1 hypothetical protein [Ruminococcus sp.]
MKLKRMNGYLKDQYQPYKDLAEKTEFSKQGLADFYKKTGKYLFVTLTDGEYTQVFDMEGTFSAEDELSYPHTGKYSCNEKRDVKDDEYVEMLADAYDVKMFILFFEKGLDMKYLLDRKPLYPAIDMATDEFTLRDDRREDEEDFLFRDEFPDSKAFVNACLKLRSLPPIE